MFFIDWCGDCSWAGRMRVEISGTAFNCLLLVTGLQQPGFKMLAASLKPPRAISLPGTRLAPITGTLSFSFWMQLGSHPIQPPRRELEKGKQNKTGEIQQPTWWSFHPSRELSPISHDNEDAAGRTSLSWGVESLLPKRSCVGRQERGPGDWGLVLML